MTRRSAAEWQELMEQYEASGKSAQAWCEAYEIKQATFEKHYRTFLKLRKSVEVEWVTVKKTDSVI